MTQDTERPLVPAHFARAALAAGVIAVVFIVTSAFFWFMVGFGLNTACTDGMSRVSIGDCNHRASIALVVDLAVELIVAVALFMGTYRAMRARPFKINLLALAGGFVLVHAVVLVWTVRYYDGHSF